MSRVTDQYQYAQQYLAGGVTSSTRVNRAVGDPLYFDRGQGCRLWDLDGREYIDLCCSHGATLLGHGDERVRRAVEQALQRGAPCSYENETHAELARLLFPDVIHGFRSVEEMEDMGPDTSPLSDGMPTPPTKSRVSRKRTTTAAPVAELPPAPAPEKRLTV